MSTAKKDVFGKRVDAMVKRMKRERQECNRGEPAGEAAEERSIAQMFVRMLMRAERKGR